MSYKKYAKSYIEKFTQGVVVFTRQAHFFDGRESTVQRTVPWIINKKQLTADENCRKKRIKANSKSDTFYWHGSCT